MKAGPLFAFAGTWTVWRGVRGPKSTPVDGEQSALRFPDDGRERHRGPGASKSDAGAAHHDGGVRRLATGAIGAKRRRLQRPLPDEAMRVVATGAREDRHDTRLAIEPEPRQLGLL